MKNFKINTTIEKADIRVQQGKTEPAVAIGQRGKVEPTPAVSRPNPTPSNSQKQNSPKK